MRSKHFFKVFSGGIALYTTFSYFNKHVVYTKNVPPTPNSIFLSKINFTDKYIDLSDKYLTFEDMKFLESEIQKSKYIEHIKWGLLSSDTKQIKLKIEDKIIKNSENYHRYPTDFIYALLSAHVYKDSQDGDKVEFEAENVNCKHNLHLDNWKVQKTYDKPEAGRYYAASYTNDQDFQLVLAHRGTTTTFKDLFNPESPWATNIKSILIKEIGSQQAEAFVTTKDAVKYAIEHGYSFSSTGHSLGAWLAELSLYHAINDSKVFHAKAVTFDSPGSIIMQDYANDMEDPAYNSKVRNLDITTYLAAPNFVNTCNKHVGKAYRIFPKIEINEYFEKYSIIRNIMAPFLSITGHGINGIIAVFDPITGKPIKYQKVLNWPKMKYTSKDNVGSNLLKGIIDEITLMKLLDFLIDLKNGKLDLTEYLKCYEYLTEIENGKILSDLQGFYLKYEGHYEIEEINDFSSVLEDANQGSADWYLKQLVGLHESTIDEELGLDSLSSKQLKKLKAAFEIKNNKANSGKPHLESLSKLSVHQLRELMDRLVEVNPDINSLLEKLEKAYTVYTVNMPNSPRFISSLGSMRIENFILHEDEMNQLDRILQENNYAIISGLPGIGKSSLAIEYICKRKEKNEVEEIVLRINSNTIDEIKTFYQMKAKEIGIKILNMDLNYLVTMVHNAIQREAVENVERPIIFLFDNVEAETYNCIKDIVKDLPKKAKSIITTRHVNLENNPDKSNQMNLRGLNKEEAIKYIKSSHIKVRINNDKEVEDLVEHLSNNNDMILPFDLVRAIKYINDFETIDLYIDRIKRDPQDEAEVTMLKGILSKSPLAWEILQYAIRLDPDFISIDIFKKLFPTNDNNGVIGAAIKVLEEYSAVESIWQNRCNPGLQLHQLTKSKIGAYVVRHPKDALSPSIIEQNLLKALNDLFPDLSDTIRQGKKQEEDKQKAGKVALQVKLLIDNTLQNSDLVAILSNKLGIYYREVLNSYEEAFNYCNRGLKIREQISTSTHADIANSYRNIGLCSQKLGKYEEGLKFAEKALGIKEQLYPDQPHTDIAALLHDIALCHQKQKRFEKGYFWAKKAIVMNELLYQDQPNHSLAAVLNISAVCHSELDELKIAKEESERALNMRKKLYGNQPHPDLSESLSNFAVLCDKLDNEQDHIYGLKLQLEALDMDKLLSKGLPHPNLAISYLNAGNFLLKQGDPQEGLKMQRKSLEIMEEFYPDKNDAYFASILNYVGRSIGQQDGEKNIQEGLELKQRALKMRKALYPDQPHLDIVESLHDVSESLEALGELEKGLKGKIKALNMLEQLYPNQPHPWHANILNNIGESHDKQGNFKEGLKSKEQGLNEKQLYYKQEHSEIANSFYNIGISWSLLGDRTKAIELWKQAYLIRVNKLGSNHIDTKKLREILMDEAQEFLENREKREMIIKHGNIDNTILEVKQKLQFKVLNKIQDLAAENKWSYPLAGADWGIQGYCKLEMRYNEFEAERKE